MREWSREDDPNAYLLKTELGYLRDGKPSENNLLKGIYVAQVRGVFGQVTEDSQEPAEQKSEKVMRRGRRRGKRR